MIVKAVFPELDNILDKKFYDYFKYDQNLILTSNGIYDQLLDNNNIFSLVIDDSWSYQIVKYKFELINDRTTLPSNYQYRYGIDNFFIYISTNNPNGANVFEFNLEDEKLINEYMLFRNQDPNFNFNNINYNNLSDSGKNIYHMLNIDANNVYFNDVSQLSFNNLFSRILYLILVNRKINYLSSQSKTFLFVDEVKNAKL